MLVTKRNVRFRSKLIVLFYKPENGSENYAYSVFRREVTRQLYNLLLFLVLGHRALPIYLVRGMLF